MTATARSIEREMLDFYRTPGWCTDLIFPKLPMSRYAWVCDPGCGDGAIGERVRVSGYEGEVVGLEVSSSRATTARESGHYTKVIDTDFTSWRPPAAPVGPVLVIGNPPFSHALDFAQHSLKLGATVDVCFLLRVAFLAGKRRRFFHRRHPADLYVLPKRPSFCWVYRWKHVCSKCGHKAKTEVRVAPNMPPPSPPPIPRCTCGTSPTVKSRDKVTSDSCEYAWMVFRAAGPREKGVVVL